MSLSRASCLPWHLPGEGGEESPPLSRSSRSWKGPFLIRAHIESTHFNAHIENWPVEAPKKRKSFQRSLPRPRIASRDFMGDSGMRCERWHLRPSLAAIHCSKAFSCRQPVDQFLFPDRTAPCVVFVGCNHMCQNCVEIGDLDLQSPFCGGVLLVCLRIPPPERDQLTTVGVPLGEIDGFPW